jgi:hypothetical protein
LRRETTRENIRSTLTIFTRENIKSAPTIFTREKLKLRQQYLREIEERNYEGIY